MKLITISVLALLGAIKADDLEKMKEYSAESDSFLAAPPRAHPIV